MGISTLATVENALKTYYLAPIIKQLDETSGPLLAAVQKGSKYIVGNSFKFPLQYGRSGGVGARAEDGSLPGASTRKYKQATANSKNLFARLSLSDKVLKSSRDNKASFVDQLDEQMKNLIADGNDMLRRNMVGSYTGQMALVNGAVSSSKEIAIDNGSIYAFYPGQHIDAGTVSSGTFTATISDKEIEDVDYEAGKIYMKDTVTSLADNAVIVLTGNYGNELTGLADIMSTSNTIYGIDRSTNRWFRPVVIDHSSSGSPADFDSMWMQKQIDKIFNLTGEKPNFIACNDGMQRAYIDEQNTYKRNIEYMKVDGGYELVSYARTPISVEKYMPSNTMDFINTNYLYLGRLSDWDWMDEDGAILHRVDGKAAYEASLVEYAELLCTKPCAHGRMTGVKEA